MGAPGRTGPRTHQAAGCWYCGGPRPSSEHIFARSLTKLFDEPDVDRDAYPVRHDYRPAEGPPRPPKRAKAFAYTTRKFCRSCNSGWMNMVDDHVRPTLAAFASNTARMLSAAEQQALAVWGTKTVLGFFSKEPDAYRFAPRELYRELHATRAPLAGSQVWVGANNHGHMGWMGGHSLRFGPPLPPSGFGASLSFGFGVVHLIFHGSAEWQLQLQYDAHRALKTIWPTQEKVPWPPPLLVQARDLEPLAHRINADSRIVPRPPCKERATGLDSSR